MATFRTGSDRPKSNDSMLGVVAVSCAATANAFGPWVEMFSSVSVVSQHIFIHAANNQVLDTQIEIGTGAAASEVRKFAVLFRGSNTENLNSQMGVDFEIPSGSRVSARVSNTENTTVYNTDLFLSMFGN